MERTELLLQAFGTAHAVDDSESIYLVYPNRLAIGALCAPIAGGDQSTADKLNLLFALDWPPGTMIQACMYAGPDLIRVKQDFMAMRSTVRDPALRRLAETHVEYLERGTRESVDATSGLRLHDTQVVITAMVPIAGDEPSEDDLRTMNNLRAGFDQALRSAGVGFETLTPRRYIRFMESILNQSEESGWRQSPVTAYTPNELICSQIIDPGSAIEVDESGLWLGGSTRVKVMTPKQYPPFLGFGMAMRYLADPKQGARGIRENCLITLNVIIPDQEKMRSSKEKQLMWATHQASTPISRFVSYFRDRKASLSTLMKGVENGDRIVQCYLSLAVFVQGEGSDERSRELTESKAIAAATNAVSYWREFGFQMMVDRYIVLPLFCQMLPFAGEPEIKALLERYKTVNGAHATAMMPVMGSWRGTGTPLFTLFSRDGQVQPISPWDTDSNMNWLVCAQSGSGKSVFAQALSANMRSINGRVRIIDVGDSYKNLCEQLGGEYMTFGPESKICINPFSKVSNFSEEVAMLVNMLKVMIAPNSTLSDFQLAELQRILTALFNLRGTSLSIDELAAALSKQEQEDVNRMGAQLFAWTSRGPYGKYFSGAANVDFSNPMMVLELGALKEKPDLQRVVLLSLMFVIGQEVYHGDRSQKSLLMIDEGWQLLATEDAAVFIEKAYRQFRKHNGSVGVITQSVQDVWETKGGRAIAENSAHMYLLRQKSDSIDAIKRDNRLPFGEWAYDQLKTVHTVQGQYSEIMCVTPYGMGIGRLVLNDYQKVMFSTKAEDVAALKALRERGLSLGDAIDTLVRQRYGAQASGSGKKVA